MTCTTSPDFASLYFALNGSETFAAMLDALQRRGYKTIGPVVRDGVVMLEPVQNVCELAACVSDDQEKGSYRLRNNDAAGLFEHNLGPMSWKAFLFPQLTKLWSLERNASAGPEPHEPPESALAFIGVRACDAAAIRVQDRVFLRSGGNPQYALRRKNLFSLMVHCSTAARTCFCPSLGTGPEFPFDHENDKPTEKLSEIEETNAPLGDIACTPGQRAGSFYFRALSGCGKEILAEVAAALPDANLIVCDKDFTEYRAHVSTLLENTRTAMVRSMDQTNIKTEIAARLDSTAWQSFGERCLGCSNCTMVCPTCFCSTVTDSTNIAGTVAERHQQWDSCFNIDFSYTHGGARRESVASRYRQWFSHKFASWHDQFQTSGCVGCGRCIAWCPVGIDVTESLLKLKEEKTDEK